MLATAHKFLAMRNASEQLEIITGKMNITGAECWSDPGAELRQASDDVIMAGISESKDRLNRAYTRLARNQIRIETPLALSEKAGTLKLGRAGKGEICFVEKIVQRKLLDL